MKRKAQAAMEYLMTYGWAILIVIIVAAALYALGIFDPGTWTGARATGFTNVGAPSSGGWKLAAAVGPNQFTMVMSNNLPSRISIDPTATTVTVGATACTGVGVLGNTTDAQIVGIGSPFNVTANCGVQTAGSAYTTTVTITYDNLDTGLTGFTESGTLTGSVS